jgi:hypothetical protein
MPSTPGRRLVQPFSEPFCIRERIESTIFLYNSRHLCIEFKNFTHRRTEDSSFNDFFDHPHMVDRSANGFVWRQVMKNAFENRLRGRGPAAEAVQTEFGVPRCRWTSL